jgi:hypothetical protein
MTLQACLRCGSADLAMPTAGDGVSLEGGQVLASTCRACGLTGPAVMFEDRAALRQFQEQRAALYTPDAGPAQEPEVPWDLAPAEAPAFRMRGASRIIGLVVGSVFVLGGVLALLTAAGSGGAAWGTLLPSAALSLLLGLPILSLALQRREH